MVVWVYASGEKNGTPYEISVQYIDYHDDETGFTAMERCTGFSASIIAIGVANGTVPRGIVPPRAIHVGACVPCVSS